MPEYYKPGIKYLYNGVEVYVYSGPIPSHRSAPLRRAYEIEITIYGHSGPGKHSRCGIYYRYDLMTKLSRNAVAGKLKAIHNYLRGREQPQTIFLDKFIKEFNEALIPYND